MLANNAELHKGNDHRTATAGLMGGPIHLTVSLGKLSGGTAYVFVFDGSNARFAVGLRVSIGP